MRLNSSGVAPPLRTPALTASASARKCTFSGAISFHEFATPVRGRLSSSLVLPAPRYQLRVKIRSRPACRPRLRKVRTESRGLAAFTLPPAEALHPRRPACDHGLGTT